MEWIEVATDVTVLPGELVWAGSSFIVASHDQMGLVFLQSADGVSWHPLPNLPARVDFFGVHAAEESIVVWGTDPTSLDQDESSEPPVFSEAVPAFPPENVQMFTSTDGGESWVDRGELALPAGQLTSTYLREFSGFATAAINDNIAIVVIETVIGLDIERIFLDNGVDPDVYRFGYELGDDGISICLFPVALVPSDGSYDGNGPVDLDDDRLGPCADELALTFEQLELTDDDVAALTMGTFPFKIYRSLDGGLFEAADTEVLDDDPGWHPGWLRVFNGEFVGSMTNETGQSVIVRSADGLAWELGEPSRTQVESVTSDGTSLYGVEWSGERPAVVQSDDAGHTWTELDLGNEMVFATFGGPAGLAVAGQLRDESAVNDPTSVSVDKDGYIVTFSEDGLTVVDVQTGETAVALGPEEMEAPEPPETVIVEPDGSFTFLDPDTHEPLVTIERIDMANAAQASFVQPELFMGWSADGEHWGWQTATEAFGANGGIQLAVGEGAVVAMYQSFEASDTIAVRIFTASLQ